MINWKGLLKVFVVLLIVSGLYLVFADKIFTRVLVSSLQKAAGAKVEIDRSKLSLNPFGFNVHGLSLANADDPMTNSLEAKKIAIMIDLPYLLQKKVVINTVTIEGIQFDTQRTSSGALTEIKKSKKELKNDTTLKEKKQLRLNADDVFDINQLETKKQREVLDKLLNQKQSELMMLADMTPYKIKLQKIETDLNAITQISIKSVQDIKKIEDSLNSVKKIQTDIGRIKDDLYSSKQKIKDDINDLKEAAVSFKTIGAEDYEKAISTLQIDTFKSGDISNTLLKGSIVENVEKVRDVWQRVQLAFPSTSTPTKNTAVEGITVLFPAQQTPVPTLWIKTINLSATIHDYQLSGVITDITSEPSVLGKPTVYQFKSKNIGKFELNGESNFLDTPSTHTMQFTRHHWPINKHELLNKDNQTIELLSGETNTTGSVKIVGSQLDGEILTHVNKMKFQTSGIKETGTDTLSLLNKVLKNTDSAELNVDLSGNLFRPNVSISSDIDTKLKSASKRLANDELKRVKKEIKTTIDNEVKDATSDYLDKLANLNSGLTTELDAQLMSVKSLEDLVTIVKKKSDGSMNSKIEQAKEDLHNQIKNLW
jgi:uncharacterized protein (TIGR03545 family)